MCISVHVYIYIYIYIISRRCMWLVRAHGRCDSCGCFEPAA